VFCFPKSRIDENGGNSLTVIARRRAAVIKIPVAVPSNIPRITNARVIVDNINAATFKKPLKKTMGLLQISCITVPFCLSFLNHSDLKWAGKIHFSKSIH